MVESTKTTIGHEGDIGSYRWGTTVRQWIGGSLIHQQVTLLEPMIQFLCQPKYREYIYILDYLYV